MAPSCRTSLPDLGSQCPAVPEALVYGSAGTEQYFNIAVCPNTYNPSSLNRLPMENSPSQGNHPMPQGCRELSASLCSLSPAGTHTPLPSSMASLSSSNKVSRHTHPAVTSPWRWEGRDKGVKGGQLIPQTTPGWDTHGLGKSSF